MLNVHLRDTCESHAAYCIRITLQAQCLGAELKSGGCTMTSFTDVDEYLCAPRVDFLLL